MSTIKASCPSCGEIELTTPDVTLMVCGQMSYSYYSFECPKCKTPVQKPADDHVISLLMSGGVIAVVWDMPAEALEEHSGAAITYDDILDLILDLA